MNENRHLIIYEALCSLDVGHNRHEIASIAYWNHELCTHILQRQENYYLITIPLFYWIPTHYCNSAEGLNSLEVTSQNLGNPLGKRYVLRRTKPTLLGSSTTIRFMDRNYFMLVFPLR
jgi:hypothetical protein